METPLGDLAPSDPCLHPGLPGLGLSPSWSQGGPCLNVCSPRMWPWKMTPATSPTVTDPPGQEAPPAAPEPQPGPAHLLLQARAKSSAETPPKGFGSVSTDARYSLPPGGHVPSAGTVHLCPGLPAPKWASVLGSPPEWTVSWPRAIATAGPASPIPCPLQLNVFFLPACCPPSPSKATPPNQPFPSSGQGAPRAAAPTQAGRPGHPDLHRSAWPCGEP